MPEVTLRAYSRDIDEMIEREKLEEAIAHCRHILQTYPKHLETYRLLGKAYLEAKRYGDAADIFQRVLSAVPDDFVSHIGMSIVREDEGNLDAAIWHMERAFETNPSNPAIQQELKRLIGRRDGLEPHKVRLTRGALARMYAHGELYPQAIAELRSALQEDPERPDLQVLLADMYWRTNQRKEATSVANQVLEKLPYCLEANRILAANLQAKERIEEAAHYHRRLAGLDPYAAFVESALADPATIEETAVSMERLEWRPGAPMPDGGPAQPGWAATLGMEIKQSQERDRQGQPQMPQTGPLPSWLEPGEPPPFEGADQTDEADARSELHAEPEEAEDAAEPEWLSGEAARDTAAIDDEADETEDDFMRELSQASEMPTGSSDEEPEPASDADPEETPQAESEDTSQAELEDTSEAELEDTPQAESEDTPRAASESTSDIPEWMQEAGWTEATGEAVEKPVSFSDAELRSLEAGEIPAEMPAAEDEEDDAELTPAELPDWIQGIAPEPGEEEEERPEVVSKTPDWLAADDQEDVELTAAQFSDQANATGRDQDQPSDEPEEPSFPASSTEEDDSRPSFPSADAGTEDVPTWIAEDAPGATDTIVTWLGGQDRKQEAPEKDELEELPDWMKDTGPLIDKGDGGIGLPTPPAESVEPGPEEPDWMEGILDPEDQDEELPDAMDFTPEAEASEADAPSPEQPTPASDEPKGSPELPSWLSAVAKVAAADHTSEPAAPDEASDEPGEPEFERPAGLPSALEEELAADDAAEQAGAEGDELAPAEPPDWLSDAVGEPPASMDADEYLAGATEAGEELADIEPPSWMEAEQDEQEDWLDSDQQVRPAAEASDTPDWLKGLAQAGPEAADARASQAPDWLREIAEGESQPSSGDGVAESREGEATGAAEELTPDEAETIVGGPTMSDALPADKPAMAEGAPPADEAPEESGEMPQMAPGVSADMETPPHGTQVPDWLEQTVPSVPQGQSTEEPAMEQPSAQTSGAGGEDGPSDAEEAVEPAAASQEAPDWLGDIGESEQPAAAAKAGDDWLGDIGESQPSREVPDWLGDIGEESADQTESAPDWLSGFADEPAPEPPAPPPEPETPAPPHTQADEPTPGTPPADIDEEVISWLEDLAAAQEQTEVPETIQRAPEAEAETPVMEQREIPEEPEEGLEWLEQLAEQRGLDVDVSLPEAAATTQPRAPEPEAAEPAPQGAEDSAPDWLTRMATQPLPKLDEEAAKPSPTEEVAEQLEAEAPAVDPGAETIKQHADELRPDAQPAGDLAEEAEDELPEWLVHAASQETAATDLPAEAPTPAPAEPTEAPTPPPAEPEPVAEQPPTPPLEPAPIESTPAEPEEPVEPIAPEAAEFIEEAPSPEVPEAAQPATPPAPATPEPVEPAVEPEAPEAAQPPTPPEPATPEPVEPAAAPAEPVSEPAPEPAPPEPPAAEVPEEPTPAEPAAVEPPAAAEPAPEAPAAEPVEEPDVAEPAAVEPPAAAEPAPEAPAAEPAPEAVPAKEPAAPAEPAPEAVPVEEPAAAPEADQTVQTLDRSRQALASGDYEQAIELYSGLIKRKKSLNEVIEDLRMAVDRTPDSAALWQTLGDAYMKNDQSAEAIDAYRRGMEVA